MAGKADIVDHLVNTVDGVTKKQASEIIDAVFGYIGSAPPTEALKQALLAGGAPSE